jgi:hypothetical protein
MFYIPIKHKTCWHYFCIFYFLKITALPIFIRWASRFEGNEKEVYNEIESCIEMPVCLNQLLLGQFLLTTKKRGTIMLKKTALISAIIGLVFMANGADLMNTNEMKSAIGGFGEQKWSGTFYYQNTSTRLIRNVRMPDGRTYTNTDMFVNSAAPGTHVWNDKFSYSSTGAYSLRMWGSAPLIPFTASGRGLIGTEVKALSDSRISVWVPFASVSFSPVVKPL